MARNKVLEKAKVTMPSGRSPFDLSQIRSYDALAGEIGICYCQPMVAGTKGTISRKCFTRTAEVVSPAFHSVTEHFDFFIVPIHSLWRSWENWKLNINDLQDTLTVPFDSTNNVPNLSLPSYAPRMNFNNIIDRTFNISQSFATSDAADAVAHRAHDALRLLDQLGYDEFVGSATSLGSKMMNIFKLGSYQKCYYEHFRNTAYESNNPYAYNFDWLYDSTHIGVLDPDANNASPTNLKDIFVAENLFRIRRVNYRNDYFHNIYPSLNYVSSQPSGVIWSIPSNIGGATPSVNPNIWATGIGTDNNASLIQSASNITGWQNITAQSVRSMFALDKLMRASAYAPKHVREQYKALYGVEGVEDFDMKSERIGSFQSDVAFQEVTNMAQSGNFDLGLLGAKGVGGDDNSKPINFYCKYDSIVIGLHYFMPRARYDSLGLHPWNVKIAREDFYIKAFENLGLRPFYAYYIDGQRSNVVVGWTVPNMEYKILPDLNTGAFKRKFCAYTLQGSGPYTLLLDNQRTSELSTYVPHNESVFTGAAATAEYFKVAPEDLNNIFKQQVWTDHGRDFFQFFGEFRISVPIVAPMSVHGQPSL